MKTLHETYLEGRSRLGSLPEGELEARLLLYKALSIEERRLFADPDLVITSEQQEVYFDLVRKRLSGIPTAYLTGRREFWSMSFEVGPGVLIPRPETELVVEKVLELAGEKRRKGSGGGKGAGFLIADIGAGCGCIAISLAKELLESTVIATDASEAALTYARRNASALGINNIEFCPGEFFEPLIDKRNRGASKRIVDITELREVKNERSAGKANQLHFGFDFIVSNPPYVSASEWETLEREVREHEPREALVAGDRGLEVIERLIPESFKFLKPGGHLIFEIGFGQKESVLALFGAEWGSVACFDDLGGIPRAVVARK